MASKQDELAIEINRMISSQYPVALKALHSILNHQGVEALQTWADRANLRNIRSLVSLVLEAVEVWPYVTEILNDLARVQIIRQEILLDSPEILSVFLGRAKASRNASDPWNKFCVIVLSEPLPAEIPLPSVAQEWFCDLFEEANANPCIATVEPLYFLADGACGQLLKILPFESLDKFREHLTNIMRTVKTVEDQYLSLLCLSILAKMRVARDETWCDSRGIAMRFSDTCSTATSPLKPLQEIDKFFAGDRASKTIHLLVLQVIYSCRGEQDPSLPLAFNHIKLAREVAEAVKLSIRHEWADNNPQILRKLHEKMFRQKLDRGIQIEAFAFAILFAKSDSLPSTAIETYQQTMLHLTEAKMKVRTIESSLAGTLPFMAPISRDTLWRELVLSILRTLLDTQSSSKAVCINEAIVRQLKILISKCGKMRVDVLRTMAMTDTRNLVNDFIESKRKHSLPRNENGTGLESTTEILCAELGIQFCCLIIEMSLFSREDDVSIDASLVIRLLQKQNELLCISQTNSKLTSQRQSTIPRAWSENISSQNPGISYDWRGKLAGHVNAEAEHLQHTLIKFMEQVCYDFESRCENMEQPLREEQLKRHEVQSEVNNLKSNVRDLENQLVEKSHEMESLKRGKAITEEELDALMSKLALLQDETANELDQLRNDKTKVQDELSKNHLLFEKEKLDLRATIACNAEQLEELTGQIKGLEISCENYEESLKEQQKSLETSTKDLNAAVAQEKKEHQQSKNDLHEANTVALSLRNELNALQNRLDLNSVQSEEHISELRTTNQRLEDKIAFLESQHQNELSDVSERAASEKAGLEKDLLDLQRDYRQLQDSSRTENERKDMEIQHLVDNLQSKSDECNEKSVALEELQELRNRLLTAMGFPENKSLYVGGATTGNTRIMDELRSISEVSNAAIGSFGKDRTEGLEPDHVSISSSSGQASATAPQSFLRVKEPHQKKFGSSLRTPINNQTKELHANTSSRTGLRRTFKARGPLADISGHVLNTQREAPNDQTAEMTSKIGRGLEEQAGCHTPQRKDSSFEALTLSGLTSFYPSTTKKKSQAKSGVDEATTEAFVDDIDGSTMEL